MRKVINGKGQDTTAQVLAYMAGNNALYLADLYLIGEPEDADALWLTSWSTSLYWSYYGKQFLKTNIERGAVKSSIGLKLDPLNVRWSPNNFNFTQDINTTSPYQQTYLGKLDGKSFRMWMVFMPTPGDADTFGAAEWFGGRIGNSTVLRASIQLTVNSFLDVVNQDMPGSVIETLNTIAGFKGATPPTGLTQVPTFVVTSAGLRVITADCASPTPGQIFASNAFQGGFLQFTSGQLQGMWSAIQVNYSVAGPHNQFEVYKSFPWAPAVGDTFYASATFPINQADGQYFGFPYVPDPNSAL